MAGLQADRMEAVAALTAGHWPGPQVRRATRQEEEMVHLQGGEISPQPELVAIPRGHPGGEAVSLAWISQGSGGVKIM